MLCLKLVNWLDYYLSNKSNLKSENLVKTFLKIKINEKITNDKLKRQ